MRPFCAFLPSFLSFVIFLLLVHKAFCAKIIGGKEVVPHSRPYMVLLDGPEICAGALIKENWVLTAAHCYLDKNSKAILGAHTRKSKEPEKQITSIKEEINYPDYNRYTKDGDLKLLKLNKEAILNKYVEILDLPNNAEDVNPGTQCRVAGWGMYQSNLRKPSNILKEVNITVLERKICNDENHYNNNPVIKLNMICAGSLQGGTDTCKGDSGSPLICDGVLRGITSFGRPGKCGDSQGPGIYTRLTKEHLEWIKKIIGMN
ncbi:PREDICTED: granzyme A-like [Elephantulus edwardii]|uniref:granzyme A-like n=1 Tax=Elephantulus edwardii TaxID=28737 RepID=UPI0003F0B0F1|nr:PREDICTED: granzyme A-like [Elephantulus edwardii]